MTMTRALSLASVGEEINGKPRAVWLCEQQWLVVSEDSVSWTSVRVLVSFQAHSKRLYLLKFWQLQGWPFPPVLQDHPPGRQCGRHSPLEGAEPGKSSCPGPPLPFPHPLLLLMDFWAVQTVGKRETLTGVSTTQGLRTGVRQYYISCFLASPQKACQVVKEKGCQII